MLRRFSFLVTVLIALSCSKYEDGGKVRKASFNILTTWKLDKYLRNNTNKDEFLLFRNYTHTYYEDSVVIISYEDTSGNSIVDTGLWFFTNDERFLHYEEVDSILPFMRRDTSNPYSSDGLADGSALTEGLSSVKLEDHKIMKLDFSEFSFIFFQNGNTHQFNMIND